MRSSVAEYFDMRAYKESDIHDNSGFILEQVAMLGKNTLLKSGFIKALKKRESDLAWADKRAVQRSAKEADRAKQNEARRKQREMQREAEKKRAAEQKAELAREKARKAEDARLKRLRPTPTKGTSPLSPAKIVHKPIRHDDTKSSVTSTPPAVSVAPVQDPPSLPPAVL